LSSIQAVTVSKNVSKLVAAVVYLHDKCRHDMTANIITREISQNNYANKVLKEGENL